MGRARFGAWAPLVFGAVPAVLSLAAAISGFGAPALAQQAAACSGAPVAQARVEREEEENSNAIDIDLDGKAISTTVAGSSGIRLRKTKTSTGTGGTGDIDLTFSCGSITTTGPPTGEQSDAIRASNEGAGDIGIEVRDSAITATGFGVWASGRANVVIDLRNSSVTTSEEGAHGISGEGKGDGDVDINLRDTRVTTAGMRATGVEGVQVTGAGALRIRIDGGSIATSGDGSHGIGADHGGTGDMDVRISGATITTTGNDASYGIVGTHGGNGKLKIRVSEGSTVKTEGGSAVAIYGYHKGTKAIEIHVEDSRVESEESIGIYALRYGASGDIDIDVLRGAVRAGDHGIYAFLDRTSADISGTISIDVRDSTVAASGASARGIYARHQGAGGIDIDVTDSTVTSAQSRGIYALRSRGAGDIDIDVRGSTLRAGDHGIYAFQDKLTNVDLSGGIVIGVRDSTVTASGANRYGLYARHQGAGDIDIDVVGSTVTSVQSRGIYALRSRGAGNIDIDLRGSTLRAQGYGIYAFQDKLGSVAISGGIGVNVRDSTITTSGASARGIYARHQGTGDINIHVTDSTITTSGDHGAHGIYAWHEGDGAVDILIRNSVIRATGAASHGIRIRGGGLDASGNRRQTVSVNSEVWGGSGTSVGILLEGGGRVTIGPHGRVGGASGIAVWVTRADPTDTTETPHLHLDVALNGRVPEKVLLGRVVNDDGTAAVTVNNVLVFDDAAGGAVEVRVPNGAWEVSAAGTALSTLAFESVFAPRAAVYEALPGVLLRLDEPGGIGDGDLLRSPGMPVWARIAGGRGSYRARRATVGADYDVDRFSVETGVDFPLDQGPFEGELTGWAGLRIVSGSAKVSAPTGGGRIEAVGRGVTGGLAWEGEDDWYGKGRLSLTRYSADLISAARGGLKSGAGALVHSLGLEGGRRFGLDLMGVKTRLTARGVLRRSGILLDKFDDGLFSRVSVREGDRLAAGAGVIAETGLLPSDGADRLVLRGSLDAEQVLNGGSAVDVSDTLLESKAGGTRFGAGFGAAYRMGNYTIGGSVKADGLGSGDSSYSGSLGLRIAF